MPDPSVSPADTIPYGDLRLEVAGAVERGDEYHPVSVASLAELLDAYDERAALLAVGERDRARIAQLTEPLKEIAVEVKLADDLSLKGQIAAFWQVVRRHSKIAADALAMGDNPSVAPVSGTGTERQASATSPDVSQRIANLGRGMILDTDCGRFRTVPARGSHD